MLKMRQRIVRGKTSAALVANKEIVNVISMGFVYMGGSQMSTEEEHEFRKLIDGEYQILVLQLFDVLNMDSLSTILSSSPFHFHTIAKADVIIAARSSSANSLHSILTESLPGANACAAEIKSKYSSSVEIIADISSM